MDNVELEFTDEALALVAKEAIKRKTGARGLRAIMEKAMMDAMYNIPSEESVIKCIINKDVVAGTGEPELVYK